MRRFEAAVVLHLRIRVREHNHEALRQYIREAFPVFEAGGDCEGAVYVDASDPELFDEVFYYRDEAAYQAGERALRENAEVMRLIEWWHALVEGPPAVVVQRLWGHGGEGPLIAAEPVHGHPDEAVRELSHCLLNRLGNVISGLELIGDGLAGTITEDTRLFLERVLENAEEMKAPLAELAALAHDGRGEGGVL